jgi:hypothetical protein
MNRSLLLLPLFCGMAVPAQATGGLICRTAGARPLEVSLVLGHTAVSSVVSASLRDNGRNVPVSVAQSWLEPSELRLDLADPKAVRREARLLAKKNGRFYDGTISRGGRTRWVRCGES